MNYVSPPIEQYLKFKNHCSLIYIQLLLRVNWTKYICLQMLKPRDDADWTENKETEKAMDGDSAAKTNTGRKNQDLTEKPRLDGKDETVTEKTRLDGKDETVTEKTRLDGKDETVTEKTRLDGEDEAVTEKERLDRK